MMPTKTKLDLDGFDQYLEDLVQAGEDIDQIAEEALIAGAGVLVGGMQRRATFSKKVHGAIKRTDVMHDGNKHYLYVGVLRDTDAEIIRKAAAWEFGGRDMSKPRTEKQQKSDAKHKNRISRPGLEAHPFIRPALRNNAKAAKAAMEAVFQEWLNK